MLMVVDASLLPLRVYDTEERNSRTANKKRKPIKYTFFPSQIFTAPPFSIFLFSTIKGLKT